MCGGFWKRDRKCWTYLIRYTFLKWSPSLINGTVENNRFGFIVSSPWLSLYKSEVMRNKSLVDFTGKNLVLGTLIPMLFLKCLIAAPTAVSNCTTLTPSSLVLLLTMISSDNSWFVTSLLIARKETHKLLVLKILNFLIDLKSSS